MIAALKLNPVFAAASDAALERLAANIEARAIDVGERVLDEGAESEVSYALVSGTLGVFYSSGEGEAVLVKIFGAPAVFGEMEMLWSLPRLEYVEAFMPSVVMRIGGATLQAALQEEPKLAFAMLRDVARRLCIAAYHERALTFQSVPMRLAGLLLSFAEGHQRQDRGAVLIDVPLTYEMLARCLGTTTRSVDRAFATWLAEGWLERTSGRCRILDVAALEAHADPARIALFHRLR